MKHEIYEKQIKVGEIYLYEEGIIKISIFADQMIDIFKLSSDIINHVNNTKKPKFVKI